MGFGGEKGVLGAVCEGKRRDFREVKWDLVIFCEEKCVILGE